MSNKSLPPHIKNSSQIFSASSSLREFLDRLSKEQKRNQELLILFGITFASSFLLKLVLSTDFMKGGNVKEKVLTHSSRAPF